MKLHNVIPVFFSLLLLACDNSGTSTLNNTKNKIKIPVKAIDFRLPDLAGKTHSLNEYLNKGPVLLVFFTTWCPYCKKEIPNLKQAYYNYGDKNLQLVAINAGLTDSLSNAKNYALKNRLPYVVLYDEDAKVSAQYGLKTVPKIFYIQQDRNIVLTSRKVQKQTIEDLLGAQ